MLGSSKWFMLWRATLTLSPLWKKIPMQLLSSHFSSKRRPETRHSGYVIMLCNRYCTKIRCIFYMCISGFQVQASCCLAGWNFPSGQSQFGPAVWHATSGDILRVLRITDQARMPWECHLGCLWWAIEDVRIPGIVNCFFSGFSLQKRTENCHDIYLLSSFSSFGAASATTKTKC